MKTPKYKVVTVELSSASTPDDGIKEIPNKTQSIPKHTEVLIIVEESAVS